MFRRLIILLIFVVCFATNIYADSFSADLVSTGVASGKGVIYFKNPDVFRTEMMGVISIVTRPLVYQLFQDTKKYCVTDMRDAAKKNPMADVANFKEWILANKMKKSGTDKINGFVCDVYKGTIDYGRGSNAIPTTAWYSERLDYPLKLESIMPAPMGKVSNQLDNIKLGDIPESIFDLPAGYTKVANIRDAMGMPKAKRLPKGGLPFGKDIKK